MNNAFTFQLQNNVDFSFGLCYNNIRKRKGNKDYENNNNQQRNGIFQKSINKKGLGKQIYRNDQQRNSERDSIKSL